MAVVQTAAPNTIEQVMGMNSLFGVQNPSCTISRGKENIHNLCTKLTVNFSKSMFKVDYQLLTAIKIPYLYAINLLLQNETYSWKKPHKKGYAEASLQLPVFIKKG